MRIGIYFGRHGAGGGMKTFALSFLYELLDLLGRPEWRDLEFVLYGDSSLLTKEVLDDLSLAPVLATQAQGTFDLGTKIYFRTLPNGDRCRIFVRLLPSLFERRLSSLLDQFSLAIYGRIDRLKLLHSLANSAGWARRPPQLVTVHDLFQAFPPEHRSENTALEERRSLWVIMREKFYRVCFRAQFRAVTQVVTDRSEVADEVARRYSIARGSIVTVPLGLDPVFEAFLRVPLPPDTRKLVLAQHDLPGEFVLLPASIDPRKNLTRTLNAWLATPESARERAPLVVLLTDPRAEKALREMLRPELDARRAKILPRVMRAELPHLVSAATVLLVPTLQEGFGLPAFEALSLGRRVVSGPLEFFSSFPRELIFECDPKSEQSITRALVASLESACGAGSVGSRNRGNVRPARTIRDATLEYLRLYREFVVRHSR